MRSILQDYMQRRDKWTRPVAVALMLIHDRVGRHVRPSVWGEIFTVLREGGRP